jgi:hypothetical protein
VSGRESLDKSRGERGRECAGQRTRVRESGDGRGGASRGGEGGEKGGGGERERVRNLRERERQNARTSIGRR